MRSASLPISLANLAQFEAYSPLFLLGSFNPTPLFAQKSLEETLPALSFPLGIPLLVGKSLLVESARILFPSNDFELGAFANTSLIR